MNQHSPDIYTHRLALEQIGQLLEGIDPRRVARTQGRPNMEAYDIRAHLNRIFGFGNWDGEADRMELISERFYKKNNRDVMAAVYRCRYTLRIRTIGGEHLATYTEWAMGDASGFAANLVGETHDFAIKTAESQALKRCAINLGDQFGLSLYCGGRTDPVVNWTMGQRSAEEDTAVKIKQDYDADPTVTPETDPDTAPGDEDYAEPVGQGKPPAQEGEVTTYTEDQWRDMYTNSASQGPYVFADFVRWAYSNGAPEPVLNALEPQMNSLNQEAQQRNMEPAHVDFASLRAATKRTR